MLRPSVFIAIVCALLDISWAASCTNPKVSVTSFTTQDATILTHIGQIAEFKLSCDNDVQPHLYAEFACGKVVPVAVIGKNKYQISWTEEIKSSSSGNVAVRLFDDDGYANLRKAQRDGAELATVKALTEINVATKGAYKGPWIKAELLAALIVGGIAYFAFTTKSKVQS